MKSQVTIFGKKRQIATQYDVVGFQNAIASALVYLNREIEMNVIRLEKDCVIDMRYSGDNAWIVVVTSCGEEVYSIDVQKR